jgi:hypothetical protein
MLAKSTAGQRQRFTPLIVGPLTESLAIQVAAANTQIAMSGDEHQAELVVQAMMRILLQPVVPCSSLIQENRKILHHPKLKGLIPDLIVKNVGAGFWGFFELKTMLKGDQLSVEEIQRDLDKLCAYKQEYPETASLFVLVGSCSKLFSTQRLQAWSRLPIRYELNQFQISSPAPQSLNNGFVAIPSGSYAIDKFPIACFIWEIQTHAKSTIRLSTSYDFVAEMG